MDYHEDGDPHFDVCVGIKKKIGFNNIPATHLDESGAELYQEQPF